MPSAERSSATVVSRPSTGVGQVSPDVHQHERAGAVGVLGHARLEARLAEQRGLLVAGDAADRDAGAARREPCDGHAEPSARRPHLGQHAQRARRTGRTARRTTPASRMSKSIVRLALDGSVACTAPPPVRFHSSHESTVPNARSASASTPPSVKQPLELGGREVRVEHQTGRGPHERRGGRRRAARRSARRCAGPATRWRGARGSPVRAIPHHDGLALVGDADGRDRLGRGATPSSRERRLRRVPDLVGVVLDPAGLGEVLGELPVRPAASAIRPSLEGDGAHAGRAGIDGDHDEHGHRHGGRAYRRPRAGVACDAMRVGDADRRRRLPGPQRGDAGRRAQGRAASTATSSSASSTAGGACIEGEHDAARRRRACAGTLPRGGTMLGSSRTNPFKIDGGVERCQATLASRGIDALVAIGGEDTLGVAAKLSRRRASHVVGVPKTIDNDLSATELTFGFDTAVQIATDAIDRLHTTAESHDRVMVVRGHGPPRRPHRDLGRASPAGADDDPHPRGAVRHRARSATRCSAATHSRAGSPRSWWSPRARRRRRARWRSSSGEVDQFGHVRLGGIGNALADGDRGAHRLRDPGHDPRPRAAGRHADRVRPGARHPLRHRRHRRGPRRRVRQMVALQAGEIVRVPLPDAVGQPEDRRPRAVPRRRRGLLRLSVVAVVALRFRRCRSIARQSSAPRSRPARCGGPSVDRAARRR